MVIYGCCEDIEIENIETKHKDIMLVKCRIFNLKFKMMIVYFSVGNLEGDRNRNDLMRIECEEIMSKAKEEESLMILEDFNGHLELIGKRKIDRNGEMVLDWLLEYDLILLNGDSKCVGQYTWGTQEQQNAIDFVLVNKEMHKHLSEMRIDEEKQVIDLSDHNLVTVVFKATKK